MGMTPEKAIRFTKYSVALVCSWPPSLMATKFQLTFFNALWYVSFVSSMVLLLPLLNAIYEFRKEPIILGKTVSLCSAVAQVVIKMSVCRLKQREFRVSCQAFLAERQRNSRKFGKHLVWFQNLFYELETFCERATADERIVLQRHVDRYKCFHCVYTLWCFITAAFVISGPLYSLQTFPTHAKYLFAVERQPLKSIIFLHQSLVGFQASAGMAIDAQVALLLRYVAVRFEILALQFRKVKCNRELDECIRTHAEILR